MTKEITFDPVKHTGINLTGFYNQTLNNLGFEDHTFTIDKYKDTEEEVLLFISNILKSFKKTFVVLPHLKPAIPYIAPALEEITGYSPVIVYLKQDSNGDSQPTFTDLEKYRQKCRAYRNIIREKIVDENQEKT